jgi:ribosomal protein S18 acetylase RimI-like enzyme
MRNTIIPATLDDLPLIYTLFEEAIRFQKDNQYIGWNNYDKEFIKADVSQRLLFKIVNENGVLGIFCICDTDKLIWREQEKEDALYLHRVVLNRAFKGVRIFEMVLRWSVEYALTNKRKFVRMDTWADNAKLINYYKTYGFRFVENYTTADTPDLPAQHRNLNVALLELEVQKGVENLISNDK